MALQSFRETLLSAVDNGDLEAVQGFINNQASLQEVDGQA